MAGIGPRPLVGIITGIIQSPERTIPAHGIGDRYILAVRHGSEADPFLIPVLGDAHDVGVLAGRLDGLFLPGGRANIEPHHFGGEPFPDDEIRDPVRDATVLPLIRECVERDVPIFGVCRGIQELNVAMGGSLHYRVHQVDGMMDHRMRRDVDDIELKFALRHTVSLAPGSTFEALVEETEPMVNSAHGQGIDRLADGLVVEALAPDGIVEGVRVEGSATFACAVQWHAEWNYQEHALSKALFEAFGDAARARASRRRDPVNVC